MITYLVEVVITEFSLKIFLLIDTGIIETVTFYHFFLIEKNIYTSTSCFIW